MNKTNIEWCGYTINPVKGLCPVDCKDNQGKSYCYARRMYKRFKWNPELDFDASVFNDLPKMKPGSKVFWGSTFELFWEGEAVMAGWMRFVFEAVKRHPELTHIFLTKQPQNLIKWSPFPENCWVGVSITDCLDGIGFMADVKASVKFISFEPLQYYDVDALTASELFRVNGISWVIIGQQTPVKKVTMPKIEWVREIVEACNKAGIPVFLKDNLESLWTLENRVEPFFKFSRPSPWATEIGKLRQEIPK